FLLYYSLSDEDVGLTVLTHRRGGEDGYFLALLSPGYASGKTRPLPKDLTFVLDTSGSMSGEKIRQAKEALLFCVNGLNPGDRFNLIRFSSDVEVFRRGLMAATPENVRAAREFVSGLRARGGTDINTALLRALRDARGSSRPSRPHMILFLTDGQPTVGVRRPEDILRNVRKANAAGRRVFVFGVGYRVNTHLLDKLSGQIGGASDYVSHREDIEVKVSSFFRKVSEPVLADLSLEWGGLQTRDVYPRALPDLFRGSQIVLLGRYKAGAVKKVRLTGSVEGERKTFEYEVRFPREAAGNDFLPRLWAHRKVGYLLDEIRLSGETQELKDEVVRLAKKFGLVTPYTSFLAMEDEPRVARRRPDVFGGARSYRPAPAPPAAALRQKVGRGAVGMSKALQEQKAALRVTDAPRAGLRWVAGKVFRLKNGFWVDEAYKKGTKTVSIQFGSPAFFDLLRKDPKVAKYLALGKKVVFCLGGQCYRIGEKSA
ncbi:MAG: VWA domain-containing protein, partial [Nitrospinota bacterium]